MSLQLQSAPSAVSTIKRALKPTSGKIAVILSATPVWKLVWQGIDAYGNVRMITDNIPSILSFLGSWPGAIVLMFLGFFLLWLQIRKQSAQLERIEGNEQLLGSGRVETETVENTNATDVDLHAQCKNTIRLLQEDLAVHSARADTSKAIFDSFEQKHKVAIRVAADQASRIGEFVEVLRVCTHDPKLDDPMPTIKWSILLINRSVHRISVDGDVGPLFFEGHKLTEHKDILENKVRGLWPGRDGSIVFEQRLSTPEVNLLRITPNGKFEFDKVMLYVKGSDAEHVTSHRVVIFSRFRATLGKCSDERSQAVEELSAEMVSLSMECDQLKAKLKSQDPVRLTFDIDAKRTEMQYRGYSDNGKTTLIGALVRLRCSKEGDSKLAVREFRAELRSEGNEAVFDEGKLIRAYVDNDAKDRVNIEAGWTIDEPLTEFRFYDFMFEISNEALRIMGRDLFVRMTMNAIGQEPQHKDFFVNSWQDALKSASDVTLRRAG